MQAKDNTIKYPDWSYWEKSVFFTQADVTIIGGGIVGINAAIRLKELRPDFKVVLLERGVLPLGASTRNAGFACFGSMTELLNDLEEQTEDEVFSLVEKRWKGLLRLRSKWGDECIDYKSYGSYELFKEEEQIEFDKCMDHRAHFNTILHSIVGVKEVFQVRDRSKTQFGFQGIHQLVYNVAEGQLNPGRMMKALWSLAKTKGIEIYTGTELLNFKQEERNINLICNLGTLKSKKVLFATNGFTKRLLPGLEVMPARNQVLITKPISGLSIKGCFHYDKGYYYFRNVGDRVLFGGGRNLSPDIEATDEFGHTVLIQNRLIDMLEKVILPNTAFEIDQWWSGILGVGQQKKPIIEQITTGVYTAVRLGGMGVAIGTLVGEEAADLIVNT